MKNRRISEQEFIRTAERVMSDDTLLIVEIGIKEAWVLVSMLQLVCRHPDLSENQREQARALAKMYEMAIIHLHPEAMPLIDMGWDARYERPSRKKH